MLFDTLAYWLFFGFVLVLCAASSAARARIVLVIASYVFYAFWDVRFVLLLGGATLANYLFGLWIDARAGAARRAAVTLAIVANLLVLGFFKYFNFFVESFAALFGLAADSLTLRIVLPVGISFITFEGIAYVVDVYRRDLRAMRNPLDFALFVSFFPHLVAGPIIRPTDFLPQVGQPFSLPDTAARWGLREILKGLFKKVVLANYLAPIADAYFSGKPYDGAAVPAWIGVLAFSLQIYFDFSGYTDIARGCARWLGFRFPPNFERPYLATSITDFWRHWHISLSTWLRDYLYIPLGGNRGGPARTYVNLLIVMGLGGLWHGASWNFVVWGLYHGALLGLHRFARRLADGSAWAAALDAPALAPLWIGLTFVLVTLGWVPFRAPDFPSTLATLKALCAWPDLGFVAAHPGVLIIASGSLAWCLLDRSRRLQDWLVERAPWQLAALGAGVVCLAMEFCANVDIQIPFVYFQF
ncbi:MBOAT family O-acyltransferase [Dokdonella sp.]|uniref:MBOAT family O-acyltransferase n=1 Tax=Dokdonella sp. TaxID=2291710 RepID=UPI001B2E2325|nr:MBOAT family O-acyltransferase [Dokdonella sp.]MBO9664487.1 MBOAT family protein [Dokdonella sp.]